jgi:hypothetical protein
MSLPHGCPPICEPLSENSVVGREIERFFAWQSLSRAPPRELKQAILVVSSMELPMYIGTARRTTAAAFIRQWPRQQHETAKENKPLEAGSSFQTEANLHIGLITQYYLCILSW